MTSKQHIYKGAGEPWEIFPDFNEVEGHHYLDTLTGEVYIGSIDGNWIKVNDRSAIGVNGKLEVYSAPVAPTHTPEEPMLWLDTSNGDAYISVVTGGPMSPVWSWKKLTLT